MSRFLTRLIALALLGSAVTANATTVPLSFGPGWSGMLDASAVFPQEAAMNDPRGYVLNITGALSTSVSYPCGPTSCPPGYGGSYTAYGDILVTAPFYIPEPVRVVGYGFSPGPNPMLTPFSALFQLSPEQAAYFQGSGQVLLTVTAALWASPNFSARDLYFAQSIADASASLTAAPLPPAIWLMLTGLAPLLGMAKRRRAA